MVERIGALLAVSALLVAGCNMRPRPFFLAGNDGCRYEDSMYAHGASACQSGTQYRCDDGQWKGHGGACTDSHGPAARRCDLEGDTYSSGSASCQFGNQYRCDDGAWRNLEVACAGGSAPAPRAAAEGRSCLYNGATVGTQSTICKAGVTFLCEDGEWRNLGSACR